MKINLFDESGILDFAHTCFYNIAEQRDINRSFLLTRMPDYRQFDDLYDCFLADEELFFKFLDYPKSAKPDDYYTEEERVFNYHEYLNIFLAYYILRINGIKIHKKPVLECIDELIEFVTDYLFEGERILLSEKIVSLLRETINREKERLGGLRIKHIAFLTKVFAAINNDDVENEMLCETVSPPYQYHYHIKRIIYRKTHEQFDAGNFLRNSLPFSFWEYIDSFETKIPDTVLFKNFAKKVFKLEKTPKTILDASIQLVRMSFLSRVAQSQDNDCKQIQQSVLLELYNRAVGEALPALFDFRIFLEFCFILKNAESEFFGHAVYLKAITEKCTRFLNSLKNIHALNLTSDEQMFWYNCANTAAWFLALHHSWWKGVKPLLTAFRMSKIVWLKNNLSCNSHYGYNNLAGRIQFFFDKNKVAALEKLRKEMADGLADLLKPAKQQNGERIRNYSNHEIKREGFDLNYTEPVAHWRYAYIRAIGDLGVSADGRGHYLYSVLDKSAENDPDPDVRAAAKKASEELRRLRGGIREGNHTRHLFEAFWWIRQAHMISLGQTVDRDGALVLRVNEWRRPGT
jgi:hypothetical protein